MHYTKMQAVPRERTIRERTTEQNLNFLKSSSEKLILLQEHSSFFDLFAGEAYTYVRRKFLTLEKITQIMMSERSAEIMENQSWADAAQSWREILALQWKRIRRMMVSNFET